MKVSNEILALALVTMALGSSRSVLAAGPPPASSSTASAPAPANTGAPNPSDPAFITAQAAYLSAIAAMQNSDINVFLAWSQRELNVANAARNWAVVRYLDSMRVIMEQEFAEITRQQNRINDLIAGLRYNQTLMERIRLGKTDPSAFGAMIQLMGTALEFDAIREAFSRKVEVLNKDNFVPNDDESDSANVAIDFPGGDIRHLLIFVKEKNFSFAPLEDAHYLVMDALAVVSKSAAERVLRDEQEIQSIRAARIAEAFTLPK